MEQYIFTLCKVPTLDDAVEQDVAWISGDYKHVANRIVTIGEHRFILKISEQLTADKIALNSEYRKTLNLSIGGKVTVTPVYDRAVPIVGSVVELTRRPGVVELTRQPGVVLSNPSVITITYRIINVTTGITAYLYVNGVEEAGSTDRIEKKFYETVNKYLGADAWGSGYSWTILSSSSIGGEKLLEHRYILRRTKPENSIKML